MAVDACCAPSAPPLLPAKAAADLAAVFKALADARARHGTDALGTYIISMARSRADVLTVLALARRGGQPAAGAFAADGERFAELVRAGVHPRPRLQRGVQAAAPARRRK